MLSSILWYQLSIDELQICGLWLILQEEKTLFSALHGYIK
jgi:hypothetical protein